MIDWQTVRLAGFDLETTGFDGRVDKIVQYGFSGAIEDSSLVNPGVHIENSDIHGITDDMVRDAMAHEALIHHLLTRFQELAHFEIPIVIMNARFDLTFCWLLFRKARLDTDVIENLTVLDPMVIDKQLDKWRAGKRKLIDVAGTYDIEFSSDELHGAYYDSVIAVKVMRAIGEKFQLKGNFKLLHGAQKHWGRTQAVDLKRYFRNTGNDAWRDVKLGWPVAL